MMEQFFFKIKSSSILHNSNHEKTEGQFTR